MMWRSNKRCGVVKHLVLLQNTRGLASEWLISSRRTSMKSYRWWCATCLLLELFCGWFNFSYILLLSVKVSYICLTAPLFAMQIDSFFFFFYIVMPQRASETHHFWWNQFIVKAGLTCWSIKTRGVLKGIPGSFPSISSSLGIMSLSLIYIKSQPLKSPPDIQDVCNHVQTPGPI